MPWYNPSTWGADLVKRNADIPQKVFVEFDGRQSPMNYSYSEYEPATLNWSIDELLYGGYGRQNFITLFYCLPEIFAPVHEIASRVADAEWQLRRNMDDGIDYSNKQWNRLSSQPNPMMSHKQLIYQAVCYEILTGANFQYFNRPSTLDQADYNNIATWLNLPTQKLKIDVNRNIDVYSATELSDLIKSYTIGDRKFPVNNVIPMINFDLEHGNTIDKFKSPLCGAHLAIKNLIPVYEARGVIYVKRGALGFIVSKKSDESGLVSLTPKEKEEAQREFQSTYGLQGGKHQVGVTAAPVEFIKTSMSIQELQPFDETAADAAAIYATLKVPSHLIPSKDKSTFNNANTDMKSFYGDVIIPMANRYAQTQTAAFNIPSRYIYADFSKVAVLQEDKKEKASVDQITGNVMLQRFTSGVCTLNDWLASIGTDPVIGNPIYDLKIYEMSPEQLDIVKNVINLKAVSTGTPSTSQGGTEKPAIA